MEIVSIENRTRPLKSPLRVGYCSSFLCQLRGYTFRSRIPLEEGLVLVQRRDSRLDSAIHMFFVFTALTVVWINSNLEVVDVRLARPWRPAYIPARPARYVLEIAPERLGDFQIGDQVQIV